MERSGCFAEVIIAAADFLPACLQSTGRRVKIIESAIILDPLSGALQTGWLDESRIEEREGRIQVQEYYCYCSPSTGRLEKIYKWVVVKEAYTEEGWFTIPIYTASLICNICGEKLTESGKNYNIVLARLNSDFDFNHINEHPDTHDETSTHGEITVTEELTEMYTTQLIPSEGHWQKIYSKEN